MTLGWNMQQAWGAEAGDEGAPPTQCLGCWGRLGTCYKDGAGASVAWLIGQGD